MVKLHEPQYAFYQTIKALGILRCLSGSEIVLLGVVIVKCEIPSTNISQENSHGSRPGSDTQDQMSICGLQLHADKQQWTCISFIHLSILPLIWCKVINILWLK